MRLTCRRGPRDFEGAGLAETGDEAEAGVGAAGSGEAGVSTATVSLLLWRHFRDERPYRLAVRCLLLPWRGYGSNASVTGRLESGSQQGGLTDGARAERIPSQGEPPSSMAAAVQGLAVVSEDGWAILALVVLLYLAFQLLRRCLAGLTSGRGLPATRPRKCPQASLSSRGGRARWP